MRVHAKKLLWLLAMCYLSLPLAGCGFHLRGSASASLPESLWRLRVLVQDSKLANDPLLVAVKNALQTDPKIVITEDLDAPTLALFGERTDSQVLSVGSTGRVSGYMLKYEVSFRLADPKGRELLASQTVRLIRDYTFDPLNVLAKELEEQDLKRTMQRDAVQQILRRLWRATIQQ
jgi:LPS-assembly lipoprotein